jgi:ParB-like chromosome segregation protein Spo0J
MKSATEWPAANVEMRAIKGLVPYARNSRTHSAEQVDQIAASMREWGWTNPVLVDEHDMIIAGHGRILAAHKLGITDAPVMIARGWTEAQKRAYVIADNKLALNAGWDTSLLLIESKSLKQMGFDLALTGFSLQEINSFVAVPEFSPAAEETVARLDEKKALTCPSCGHEFTT